MPYNAITGPRTRTKVDPKHEIYGKNIGISDETRQIPNNVIDMNGPFDIVLGPDTDNR